MVIFSNYSGKFLNKSNKLFRSIFLILIYFTFLEILLIGWYVSVSFLLMDEQVNNSPIDDATDHELLLQVIITCC